MEARTGKIANVVAVEAAASRMVLADKYITPNAVSANADLAATILEKWIQEAPTGQITLRSKEWILDQWRDGMGIMILACRKGELPQDPFGNEKLSEEKLREVMAGFAFLNPLGTHAREEQIELGTVITNSEYQATSLVKGLGVGKRAFQAIHDLAANRFPNAEKFTWVKNGSKFALLSAFSKEELEDYEITDEGEFREVFAACIPGNGQEGCPDLRTSGGCRRCCHDGFRLPKKTVGSVLPMANQFS